MDWRMFLFGLAVGWLIELIIDYLFWRKRRICSKAEVELKHDFNRIKGEHDGLLTRFKKMEANVTEQEEKSKRAVAQLQRENTELNTQLQGLQNRIKGVTEGEQRFATYQLENAQLKKSLDELQEELHLIQDKSDQLDSVRLDNDQLRLELQTLRDKLNRAESEIGRIATFPTIPENQGDDLTKINGIGPKIAAVLRRQGIDSFVALADSRPEQLRQLLDASGDRFNFANEHTWPPQARLAAVGDWDELASLQARLSAERGE